MINLKPLTQEQIDAMNNIQAQINADIIKSIKK